MENKYLIKLTRKIEGVPYDYDPSINGIGGWMGYLIFTYIIQLILVVIIFIFFPIYFGFSQVTVYAYIQSSVTTALIALTLYFIFKRNIRFRPTMVITLIVTAALSIAYRILFLEQEYLLWKLITSAITQSLWIIYLYKSSRVRNTFVYPHMGFTKRDDRCYRDLSLNEENTYKGDSYE